MAEFPLFAAVVERVEPKFGFARRGIDAFYLHGSFVRSYVLGESCRDLDVAFADPEDLARAQAEPVGLVRLVDPRDGQPRTFRMDLYPRTFQEPRMFLDDIDYTLARVIYSSRDRHLHFDPRCFPDGAERCVRHTSLNQPLYAFTSLYRAWKYAHKGFTCRLDEMLELLDVCHSPEGLPSLRSVAQGEPREQWQSSVLTEG